MTNLEHYYIKDPKCKRVNYSINGKILGITLNFETLSGTYSPRHIDQGSVILIKSAKISSKDKILDLGCGYGTTGILVKKLHPKTTIYMTDINERAIESAKINANNHNVEAKIFQSDGFENIKNKDFDTILFNPPINAGLKVCYRLMAESFEHLKIKGTLQIVLRPREGGGRLLKKMKAIFGNVKLIGKEDIYEIYTSTKNRKEPVSKYDQKMSKERK